MNMNEEIYGRSDRPDITDDAIRAVTSVLRESGRLRVEAEGPDQLLAFRILCKIFPDPQNIHRTRKPKTG